MKKLIHPMDVQLSLVQMFQMAKDTDYIALNCALKFTYLPEKGNM